MGIEEITIVNVRQNNLKNVSLGIPLKALTVITGVSGSGKSSLAFDTLYAEGSRRYMESLSTYARQFLEQIPRPEMDTIHNLPPAIALEQRNSITSSRTTVADLTEIYDYFRLLFAAIGWQHCHACGHDTVEINSADTIAQRVLNLPSNTRLYLLAPLKADSPVLSFIPESEELAESEAEDDEEFEEPEAEKTESEKPKKKRPSKKAKPTPSAASFPGQRLFQQGFQRILVDGEIIDLSSVEGQVFFPETQECFILIDRIVTGDSLAEERSRLTESLESALAHGNGVVELRSPDGKLRMVGSHGYSCSECGAAHIPANAALFSSNSPLGACAVCSGFGETLELDEELIIPDPGKTLRDGAVDPLAKPSHKDWEKEMLLAMDRKGIKSSTRYRDLNAQAKKWLWDGYDDFPGLKGYFETLKQWRYKLHVRVFIRRYQTQRTCSSCGGSRLSEAPLRFKIGHGSHAKSIAEVLELTVADSHHWMRHLELTEQEAKRAREVLRQINDRLEFLESVGVAYLKLNRRGNSLSGGEYQRICLATQLGAKLSQTLYVLDEPSIGLHPCDTDRLIKVMTQLRDHGNTVVVVEHDSSVMRAADFLVELGPLAGEQGGKLIAHGPRDRFLADRNSLTAKYLSGEMQMPKPARRRPRGTDVLRLTNCRSNNLKSVNLEIPLRNLVAVTGLSGSGKSTLIHDTLYQALAKLVLKEQIPSHKIGTFDDIQGLVHLTGVIMLDQAPIGRSMRSNPATYIKAYDEIRRVMACQPQAARLNLSPAHFSFNVDGGRCSSCQGEGYIDVDMHFMADLRVLCPECNGKRFKQHVLEVQYRGKNIHEILHTTIRDGMALFSDVRSIVDRLQILESVGLDYLRLGQSLSTLSGGECQRLKIASTLSTQSLESQQAGGKLYIFDEPTTGLHQHDVRKLAKLLHSLVDAGNSVVFIEHNMELVGQADWVIDLGPGGGAAGGEIVAEGTPETVAKNTKSITGPYLRGVI